MAVAVGERLLIAKDKATARYVGAVDGHDGTWVGVEWDDATRGKHDGTVGGKRYFTCQSAAPTAASFIRINKVGQGTSLADALVLRYTNQLAEGHAAGDGQAYLHVGGKSKINFRLVGEDQVTQHQSRIDLLKSGRLVGANVSHVCPPGTPQGTLSITAPNLTQLDLTDNLIGPWSTVSELCQQLPNLQLLVLSRNKLSLPNSLDEARQQGAVKLPGLQCLVMNCCGITWKQVGVIQSYLPNLHELHVGGNSVTSLAVSLNQQQNGGNDVEYSPVTGFMSLQVLGLEHNAISDWREVLRLAGLPSLKRLHLSGNPLSAILYPAHPVQPTALLQQQPATADPDEAPPAVSSTTSQQQQQSRPFPELQALLLGGCQISSWSDIDQLNSFPALRECRLSGNPLFASDTAAGGAGRRYEVIGRVGGLTLLNGADVKARERRDSELRYIMYITADAAEAAAAGQIKQSEEEVAAQHPRLTELLAKYGKLSAVGVRSAQAGTTIRATTAQINLVHGSKAISKKLPGTISISALKLLCAKLFKLQPDQLVLKVVPRNGSEPEQQQQEGEDISQDDTKTLKYWDVPDGSAIKVVHIDPHQLKQQLQREQFAKQQQQEQRIAEQLQQGEVIRTAAER